jgi:hypothetical protein
MLIGAVPNDVDSSGTFILAILEAGREAVIATFPCGKWSQTTRDRV